MLGIIILNYNTWDDTEKCISSIVSSFFGKYYIYIVDNNSPKKPSLGTLSYLNSIPNLKIIYSEINAGYSAGNNIGILNALADNCDYFLISNSDVIYMENSISNLLDYLNENQNVGIVGPRVLNAKSEFQPYYMKCKLTGIGKLKNMLIGTRFEFLVKKFKRKFIIDSDIFSPERMFGVSGCCFMVSKSCIEFLYPLDENTFLYEEEYIIGVKLEKSNFEVYVNPSSTIIHNEGGTTKRISRFSFKCLIKSEQYYLKKYIKTPFVIRWFIKIIRYLQLIHIK